MVKRRTTLSLSEFTKTVTTELQDTFDNMNDGAPEWIERFTEEPDENGVRSLKTAEIRHGGELHRIPHVAFSHPSKLLPKRISLDLEVSLNGGKDISVQLDGKRKGTHSGTLHIELERVDGAEGQHKLMTKIENKFGQEHRDAGRGGK